MAGQALKTLWLLHGVNLDMLGRREPAHYGAVTLPQLEASVIACAAAHDFVTHCYQTNHEGALVEKVHEIVRDGADAVIVNPGAWTHYSYALRDALEMIEAPLAEVHLSAIEDREKWRRLSVIADLAAVLVSGKGPEGYAEAVVALADIVARREQS
jgi:3-dehydroquinate dehydratase-2